jgi:hypothetical protein
VKLDNRALEVYIDARGNKATRIFSKPLRAEDDVLVLVNTARFDAAWEADHPDYYIASGDQSDRYKRFVEYLKNNRNINVSEVYVDENGLASFINGRHRFAVLRDFGNTAIPVAMDLDAFLNAKQHNLLSLQQNPSDEELEYLKQQALIGDEEAKNKLLEYSICPKCGPILEEYSQCLSCHPLTLTWDSYEIAKRETEFLMGEEGLSQEEAWQRAISDSHLYQFEQEYINDELTRWLELMNPDYRGWCVHGQHMGWQNREGYMVLNYGHGETGEKMLGQVLPETDNTFKIFFDGEIITIHNAHHDAPLGEIYEITLAYPCSEDCGEEYCTEEEAENCCAEEG